jgi:hypothetical protein
MLKTDKCQVLSPSHLQPRWANTSFWWLNHKGRFILDKLKEELLIVALESSSLFVFVVLRSWRSCAYFIFTSSSCYFLLSSISRLQAARAPSFSAINFYLLSSNFSAFNLFNVKS